MVLLFDSDDRDVADLVQSAIVENTIQSYFGRGRSDSEESFSRLIAMSETVAIQPDEISALNVQLYGYDSEAVSVPTWSRIRDESDRNNAIFMANDPEDIIAVLDWAELSEVANRISDLYRMIRDYPCEEAEIAVESLRNLALFLVNEPTVPDPDVVIGPGGFLMTEWYSETHGTVALSFQTDGMIEFAAMSASTTAGPESLIRGRLPRHKLLGAIAAFLPQ